MKNTIEALITQARDTLNWVPRTELKYATVVGRTPEGDPEYNLEPPREMVYALSYGSVIAALPIPEEADTFVRSFKDRYAFHEWWKVHVRPLL